MSRPIVNPGKIKWTGQHWVNYLREPGKSSHSGMVSLWHTHYCVAGEGTAVFIDIPGRDGYQAICTDKPDIAEFHTEWMKGRGGIYDLNLNIVSAKIWRTGDINNTPAWEIESGDTRITATWKKLGTPVILDGSSSKFSEGLDVYSHLLFADDAEININGRSVPGTPYTTDIWASTIGERRSSCVVALSETFIEINSAH